MAVTGAAMVFSTFAGASAARSRSLAACERTNTIRSGDVLALVGAILVMSTASRSKSSHRGRVEEDLVEGLGVDPAVRDATMHIHEGPSGKQWVRSTKVGQLHPS